jgi:FkbM family methyltransferase
VERAGSLLRGPNGQPLLPSATKRADGRPRFFVPLMPPLINSDPGIRYLVDRELRHDGFERITRDVLDAHLQTGDLFIDVGAHWGVMSLSAVTAPATGIRAIAIEPDPINASMLMQSVAANQLNNSILVVSAAVGERAGVAELQPLSTMGHSLTRDVHAGNARRGLHVAVIGLDELLVSLGEDAANRIVMKIDVEGFEPEVLIGAKKTIASGRVALIVWERGEHYRFNEEVRDKANAVADWLSSLGFTHYTFPYHEWGGPLMPATQDWFFSNIFSFAPTLHKRSLYPQRFEGRPPFERQHRMERSPERMAEVARMLIEAKSSDGIRWADPEQLELGSQSRAAAAARFVTAPVRVLDLGAGNMALQVCLAAGSLYTPADLIARSERCLIADLNQANFPAGEYDVVTLLEVLEYIHDVPGLLKRCRLAAQQLILTYEPWDGGDLSSRRKRGFLSDLTTEDLAAAVHQAGFNIKARTTCAQADLWQCMAQ